MFEVGRSKHVCTLSTGSECGFHRPRGGLLHFCFRLPLSCARLYCLFGFRERRINLLPGAIVCSLEVSVCLGGVKRRIRSEEDIEQKKERIFPERAMRTHNRVNGFLVATHGKLFLYTPLRFYLLSLFPKSNNHTSPH